MAVDDIRLAVAAELLHGKSLSELNAEHPLSNAFFD
jgi:hypothetical protein